MRVDESSDAVGLSSMDVCRAAGITYRTLDYWCRSGAVAPSIADAEGSGVYRRWSSDDVAVLCAVARVADDLRTVGADMPAELAAQLWAALKTDRRATISAGTVTIDAGQV